jgi:hypothetical protein
MPRRQNKQRGYGNPAIAPYSYFAAPDAAAEEPEETEALDAAAEEPEEAVSPEAGEPEA